jgi:hypothetical protein
MTSAAAPRTRKRATRFCRTGSSPNANAGPPYAGPIEANAAHLGSDAKRGGSYASSQVVADIFFRRTGAFAGSTLAKNCWRELTRTVLFAAAALTLTGNVAGRGTECGGDARRHFNADYGWSVRR